MNPLTNIKNLQKINERELELGIIGKKSWHDEYKDSAWIFIGGLPYDLSEGDIICVFSQYGEIVNLNLVRDHKTGKSKGFAFICFEDQRSTVLSVDNLNGIKILGRTIRVDHVKEYKVPKEHGDEDELIKKIREEGCAPKIQSSEEEESDGEIQDKAESTKVTKVKKSKRKKKEKKKKKERSSSESSSSSETDSKKPLQNIKSKAVVNSKQHVNGSSFKVKKEESSDSSSESEQTSRKSGDGDFRRREKAGPRNNHREKNRTQERVRERSRDRESATSSQRERSLERYRDRSRDRDKNKDNSKARDFYRKDSRNWVRERDESRESHRGHDRERDRNRSYKDRDEHSMKNRNR
ncbi:RNA-binding motif protein, X-linked 2-like [Biomphalaria glabrata]|uniref:RNA-binding motif protein, X-linked 2 n=1 Tax=Biomphalaria glabrata TaxID=6526 RepID=A0A9W2Z216_BIOGL|nr:RNA-binding motif protein, X-linked 2-like [Biomphalaria glabrata]KAI8770620.1 RNA-binding motif protein, X-linked 2 [Biomphalaria glabrata]